MRRINKYIRLLQDEAGDGSQGGGGSGDSGASGTGDAGAGGDSAASGGSEETLLAGKYKTPDDLVKGYTELNTAYSAKDEAHLAELGALKSPETYVPGEGWVSDDAMGNRMQAVLQEIGKEHNLPQGTYEAIVNGIGEMQTRVQEDTLKEVVASIPNYDNRSKALQDTAMRFLRPDQAQSIDSLMQTKESFEAMEILMANARGGQLPSVTDASQGMSDADLRKAIKDLNPADLRERARLTDILNERGNGKGKLV